MTLQLERDVEYLDGGIEGFLSDPIPGHKLHTYGSNTTSHELHWGTGADATIPGTPSDYMDNSTTLMDLDNISLSDNTYMKNDFFMDNSSPDEAFPYHHFAFDVDILSQNSDQRVLRELIFTWEGYGQESTADAPYSALIYIWNPADGNWYQLDEVTNADNAADIIVTSIVNESPSSYFVNQSSVHFLVTGPIFFNGGPVTTLTLATDFVGLNVTWEDLIYPSDLEMDIGGDGVIDWSMSGPITGNISIVGDDVLLENIQIFIDDAGPGPGTIDVPIYFYSSTVGGLWVLLR